MRWYDCILIATLYVVGMAAAITSILGIYIGTMALAEAGYEGGIEVWILMMLGLLALCKARKLI